MPSVDESLDAHRLRLAVVLGTAGARCVVDGLGACYGSADRHYHNLRHVLAVLDIVDTLAGPTA